MGVGVIANQNYGAFNLAWASVRGRWETSEAQAELVKEFSRYRFYTSCKMGEQTIGDWVCMLRPTEFLAQVYKTPPEVNSIARELAGLADSAINLESTNDI